MDIDIDDLIAELKAAEARLNERGDFDGESAVEDARELIEILRHRQPTRREVLKKTTEDHMLAMRKLMAREHEELMRRIDNGEEPDEAAIKDAFRRAVWEAS